MTRDDANDLAKRICNTWRGNIPHSEWADYLIGFDAEQASRAYMRLRARIEYMPTLKQFGDECRTVARLADAVSAPETEPPAPRLSREKRIEILTRNGAKRSIVDAAAWAKEGPL